MCYRLLNYDMLAGHQNFEGVVLNDIEERKNNLSRFCENHQPRIGVSANQELDLNDQLTTFRRESGLGRHTNLLSLSLRQDFVPCDNWPLYLPMFVREHVGYDLSLFSGISAPQGGLSTKRDQQPSKREPKSTSFGCRAGTLRMLLFRRRAMLGSP